MTLVATALAVAILACFAFSKSPLGLVGMVLLFTLSPPAFIALLVVAKTLDRSVSMLIEDVGVDVSLKWKALRSAFEEWFELGLSMLVGLWLLQHRADADGA